MTRAIVLAIAAGCGAHPAPAPRASPMVVADAAIDTAPVAATPRVVVPRHAHVGPIEAPHAGSIHTIAITPDGTAAISSDELGGIRLWPTLDGTREPRVVELAEPKALAIGTWPDGFTVVVLDQVGGLVIADVDGDGRTRSRATLPTEPAFVGVVMTELGVLAWRVDHTIELIGDRGATQSRLGTEPGQRLVSVAAGRRRAAAILETPTGRRVRWLELAPQLAWGAWLDAGSELGGAIALSPSATRLALVVPGKGRSMQTLVIATATGAVLANEPVRDAIVLGFIDDDHLAIGGPGKVLWLDLDHPTPTVGFTEGAGVAVLATGKGRAIGAVNGELIVATPTGAEYLGYELESPTVAAAAADGGLLVGIGDDFALLDRELRETTAPTLTAGIAAGGTVGHLLWVGGDDWLVQAAPADRTTTLSLVDAARGSGKVLRAGLPVVPLLMYEPSTQLVTLSLSSAPEVDRLQPKTRLLAQLATVPSSRPFREVALIPTAPARAGGVQVVRIGLQAQLTLEWLRDPTELDKVSASATIDGSFAAADSAGHVFVWRNFDGRELTLVVYADGKPTGTLPHDGPVAVWPDPAGTRVVEIGQRTVSLVQVDGAVLWTQDLVAASQALWLADGAIAIVTAAGIARVDAATGAVTAARCGWKFGRSAKLHPMNARIEPVCVELDRQ